VRRRARRSLLRIASKPCLVVKDVWLLRLCASRRWYLRGIFGLGLGGVRRGHIPVPRAGTFISHMPFLSTYKA